MGLGEAMKSRRLGWDVIRYDPVAVPDKWRQISDDSPGAIPMTVA
jgi:hypothetical protein